MAEIGGMIGMVQGHSRPVESGSRKMEAVMWEEDEEEGERICSYCSGTGEVAVGWGACPKCGGDGLLREIEDYEDLNEWERSMGW